MSGTVPVSVLIPAKNEIANIRACIDSVRFASEIVVVDSLSTDGTVEAAREAGATVVPFAWNREYPKKKNWALEHVPWKNDWVLILDADERITSELADEIQRAVASADHDGYYLNRRFMFMGGWLRHCGYYPSWNLRLVRHRLGRYERIGSVADTGSGDNEVHEHVLLEGNRVGWLKNDMLHFAYPTIDVWVEKHNRYANWEATIREEMAASGGELGGNLFGTPLERKRWIRRQAMRLPFRPALRFFYHYVIRQGFRDGYRGYVFCRLLAWYEFLGIAKAAEKVARASRLRE
ncbi:glycosyltransferase [bacterium]|nr:glycosyltransferase [bacterium]